MQDILYGALAGDMAALNALWLIMLPFVLIYAGIKWLINKAK